MASKITCDEGEEGTTHRYIIYLHPLRIKLDCITLNYIPSIKGKSTKFKENIRNEEKIERRSWMDDDRMSDVEKRKKKSLFVFFLLPPHPEKTSLSFETGGY